MCNLVNTNNKQVYGTVHLILFKTVLLSEGIIVRSTIANSRNDLLHFHPPLMSRDATDEMSPFALQGPPGTDGPIGPIGPSVSSPAQLRMA